MDVDQAHAKRIILVSIAGVGVLTTMAVIRRRNDLPPSRVIAGVFVSGVMLSAMAEFQPKIAAGIAALMLTTAAFALSPDAWAGVSNAVGGKPKIKSEAERNREQGGGGGGSPKRPA